MSRTRRPILIGMIAGVLFVALSGLGVWQVRRLAWKQDLIARVDARLHAAPVEAPGPHAWATVSDGQSYLRIAVKGAYLRTGDTLVQASTVRGPGFWVMTPLRTDRGFTLMVNRGFVEKRMAVAPPRQPVTLTGLLRVSEPGGGFLRSNDPRADRWYSRDIAAIAAHEGLARVAPYFMDADAASSPPDGPIGGLTVVSFPDNHLVYALTWFALALMVAGATFFLLRNGGEGDRPAG